MEVETDFVIVSGGSARCVLATGFPLKSPRRPGCTRSSDDTHILGCYSSAEPGFPADDVYMVALSQGLLYPDHHCSAANRAAR
jgi:hypothetical protein